MNDEFPFTRDEFREWRKQNPDRGIPTFAGGCPMAECMKDLGYVEPYIYYDWGENFTTRGGVTPKWAIDWIRHYDQGEELPLDDTAVPSLPAPVASESRRPVFAVMRPW